MEVVGKRQKQTIVFLQSNFSRSIFVRIIRSSEWLFCTVLNSKVSVAIELPSEMNGGMDGLDG